MLNFIKRRLRSQKGAMDTILVTLLLVVVGIGAVVGLTTWVNDSTDTMKDNAATQLENVNTEISDGQTDDTDDNAS